MLPVFEFKAVVGFAHPGRTQLNPTDWPRVSLVSEEKLSRDMIYPFFHRANLVHVLLVQNCDGQR
jgi:hypothetical protein